MFRIKQAEVCRADGSDIGIKKHAGQEMLSKGPEVRADGEY